MHHACWDKLSGGFAGTRFIEHAREAHRLDLCKRGVWFANGENVVVVEYRKVKSETQTQNDAMHHACWDKLSGGFAGIRFVEHAREAHCLDLCKRGVWFANGENVVVVEYRKVKSETQTQMDS